MKRLIENTAMSMVALTFCGILMVIPTLIIVGCAEVADWLIR